MSEKFDPFVKIFYPNFAKERDMVITYAYKKVKYFKRIEGEKEERDGIFSINCSITNFDHWGLISEKRPNNSVSLRNNRINAIGPEDNDIGLY